MTPERRVEISKKAAEICWKKWHTELGSASSPPAFCSSYVGIGPGPRDTAAAAFGSCAFAFMDDVRERLANGVQLTTDGHKAFLDAVEEAFGADIDYAMLVKQYGQPDGKKASAERRYSPADPH